jgi:hypothetical protein
MKRGEQVALLQHVSIDTGKVNILREGKEFFSHEYADRTPLLDGIRPSGGGAEDWVAFYGKFYTAEVSKYFVR